MSKYKDLPSWVGSVSGTPGNLSRLNPYQADAQDVLLKLRARLGAEEVPEVAKGTPVGTGVELGVSLAVIVLDEMLAEILGDDA